ncbi:flagellar motor switch protein FliN [Bifidobacterium dolichotidis]|uniref:Flagellar motor switch protein FliN n=1 Tax=Bifidobacterium dolichotidis TaxID=2306976 RepID=A0A430FKZ5_9BIFI|nr:hypothetical protein [Bifidobacterium dolichotidis]RSX53378.1 flagellar motor switch protein FliN [Bifidobacterium dolichotidis]
MENNMVPGPEEQPSVPDITPETTQIPTGAASALFQQPMQSPTTGAAPQQVASQPPTMPQPLAQQPLVQQPMSQQSMTQQPIMQPVAGPSAAPKQHAVVHLHMYVFVLSLIGAFLLGAIAMFAITRVAGPSSFSFGPSRSEKVLKDAHESCQGGFGWKTRLGEDGSSLYLEAGKYKAQDAMYCVASATDMPSSVKHRILQTNAFNGVQTGEWDEFEASWTYDGSDDSNSAFTLSISIKDD